MKFSNIIKSLPLISILILVIYLNLTNPDKNTKLKILIWDTPTLSLGTYIAISSASGFILSYLITDNIAKYYKPKTQERIKYRSNNKEVEQEKSEFIESSNNNFYDNTLIERDIKDPAPTLNANFRVIGKTERLNKNFKDKNSLEFSNYNYSNEYKSQSNKIENNTEDINDKKPVMLDWEENSFENW